MKVYKIVDKLHGAIKRGIVLDLPEYVELCPICKGLGSYEQTYTAGCGMGTYRSSGPCEYCKHNKLFMTGSGFRDINIRNSVTESVLNQIYYMNRNVIEVSEQLEPE